jgi:hypothetical protein
MFEATNRQHSKLGSVSSKSRWPVIKQYIES